MCDVPQSACLSGNIIVDVSAVATFPTISVCVGNFDASFIAFRDSTTFVKAPKEIRTNGLVWFGDHRDS